MAEKPNLVSLLRCRWGPGLQLPLSYVLHAATDVASALAYLHRNGICHGDVYAHNVLADAAGRAVLCDYGESPSSPPPARILTPLWVPVPRRPKPSAAAFNTEANVLWVGRVLPRCHHPDLANACGAGDLSSSCAASRSP